MISFANINKQYGKQLLFVDASFQLNPGGKVGLVGPNGAGKTTLFRMVVGEETPNARLRNSRRDYLSFCWQKH
jgi:ATPase subunit of ABC transporter with duplicated ATPase domains